MKKFLLALSLCTAAVPAFATDLPRGAMRDPDNPERIILHPTPMQRRADTPGYDGAGAPKVGIIGRADICMTFYARDCHAAPKPKPATAPPKLWPVDL